MALFTLARALGRIVVANRTKLGWGSNRIVRDLKRLGVSYKYPTMLGDIRQFAGFMKYEKKTRNFPGDKLLPQGLMLDSKFKRARRYRVYGDIWIKDSLTGDIRQQTISFYDNKRRTTSDWMTLFIRQYKGNMYSPDDEIIGAEVRTVEHNRKWAY